MWKFRVHDAVITSKLLYGLESASMTKSGFARLDSFQMKARRRIPRVPHSFYSHVSNEDVMELANQRRRLAGGKTMKSMSERLRN